MSNDWGKVKFVPKTRKRPAHNSRVHANPNNATPWKHFKNEIIEKHREEQNTNTVNMDSAEAQEMLKKREQNYRRNLITSQTKQPTKWEKFDDESDKNTEIDAANDAFKKFKEKKKQNKKNPFAGDNDSFAGINLQNFDAKELTFKQNNTMRKVITKGHKTNESLGQIVNDLKEKKKKNKKICGFV